jgi:uncharacterized protein (TIGR01589 family)
MELCIEACGDLQVVYTLQQQAKVEPGFTQLVWQKLEEQNPDFFKAYYTRLKLKDQIVLFNHLLEQQVAMFQKMQRQWMAPTGGEIPPQALPDTISKTGDTCHCCQEHGHSQHLLPMESCTDGTLSVLAGCRHVKRSAATTWHHIVLCGA